MDIQWPKTDEEWCIWHKAMDIEYGTRQDSPLHHDNKCKNH